MPCVMFSLTRPQKGVYAGQTFLRSARAVTSVVAVIVISFAGNEGLEI